MANCARINGVPNLGCDGAVATSQYVTCAITAAGQLKCWGWDVHGQLGYNVGTHVLRPRADAVDVGAGRVAVQVSTYASMTCAVLDNGELKCWGRGYEGTLGYGDTQDRRTPGDPIDLGGDKAAYVGVGNKFACALTRIGTVKCWGPS